MSQDGLAVTVNFDAPTMDSMGQPVTAVCSPQPGSPFEVGTHEVMCGRSDDPGVQCTFSVTVAVGADPIGGGICDRTVQVRDAIVDLIPGINTCSAVTDAHLAAVTGLLTLKDTGISSLRAGDFAGLTSLRSLLLRNNPLTTLPADIFSGLTSLRSLRLPRNQLTTLPAGIFSGLVSLETLRVTSNELQSLPSNVFAGLVKLNILDLEFNNLTTLPDGLFTELNLRFLGLEGNQLHTLRAGMFEALSGNNLILDVSHNALTTLEDGVFTDLGDLVWLDLANNQLQTLPAGVFAGLTRMQSLYLEQNPGAVFTFTMTLERVPNTNTVVVVVPEGAPFDMTTTISATGGLLPTGVSTVTVPVGRTRSDEIAITPLVGATVSLGTAPAVPSDFDGIVTAVANPLTIAGARALLRNDAPVPALSVADAEVQEGPHAELSFAVTLSRAPLGPVTVAYATANGTATAGSDYTAASGTLVFAAGETAKTVTVTVRDDAHDEGRETLTLGLSNASGAHIRDGTATGTITNADPLPQAWLARFGRTAATHVTEAVGERLRGDTESHVTVSGYRLALGNPAAVTVSPWAEADRPPLHLGPSGTPRLRDVLLGSSFRLNLGDDAAPGHLRLTAWGRVAGTRFDGRDGDLTLDGDVLTGTVGVDGEWDRLLAGVAVAHSRGQGGYTMPDMDARGQGDLETALTSLHPYLRYAVTERLDVWGLLGYGWGDLTMQPGADATLETDTTFIMGAFGSRGILLSATENAGFQLATRTDAMLTRTTSDAVTTGAGSMASSEAEAHRLRLVLEGSRGLTWPEGRTLTPTMEIGLRHDWGDAETGFGLELGGRVQYADPRLGLTIDGAVRGLLAHEDTDYQEWGASGSLRIAPGAGGQGLSLTLAPTWGAASSGMDGLWSRQTTAGLAPQDTRTAPTGRLNAEVSYGVSRGLRHRTSDPLCGHGARGGRGPHLPPRHPLDRRLGSGLHPGRPTPGTRQAHSPSTRASTSRSAGASEWFFSVIPDPIGDPASSSSPLL